MKPADTPTEAAPMCFACGQQNPIGLRIDFVFDGDICRGEFTGDERHVGWENTIHGGIIYAALDDVTANVLHLQGQKAHTAKCEIRYRQPLCVGETIAVRGWVEKQKGRLVMLRGEAHRVADGALIAECDASFILVK